MPKEFMIGADPEIGFVNLNNGRTEVASTLLSDPGLEASFGLDGCGRVAELRPSPSIDPLHVVSFIRHSMLRALRKTPELQHLDWKAGSMVGQNPIGGHIHFGTANVIGIQGVVDTVLPALDRYLAIPLALLEDDREFKLRRNNYGALSDYREQPHGFEYRTPSSWLTSPFVARGVLTLARVIVYACLNRGLTVNVAKRVDPGAFNQRDTDYLTREWKNEIWPTIELFTPAGVRDGVEPLRQLIDSGRNWYPKASLKDAWFLTSYAEIGHPLRAMSFGAIWRGVKAEQPRCRTRRPTSNILVDAGLSNLFATEYARLVR